MKKENIARAKELFEKEPKVEEVYFTTDGNMFRALHYARGWQPEGIETVRRSTVELAEKIDEMVSGKAGKATVAAPIVPVAPVVPSAPVAPVAPKVPVVAVVTAVTSDERAALVKRYIELFDKKPAQNIGDATLKMRIEEKEAALKLEGKKDEKEQDSKQEGEKEEEKPALKTEDNQE